jgi:hypothetical protein
VKAAAARARAREEPLEALAGAVDVRRHSRRRADEQTPPSAACAPRSSIASSHSAAAPKAANARSNGCSQSTKPAGYSAARSTPTSQTPSLRRPAATRSPPSPDDSRTNTLPELRRFGRCYETPQPKRDVELAVISERGEDALRGKHTRRGCASRKHGASSNWPLDTRRSRPPRPLAAERL